MPEPPPPPPRPSPTPPTPPSTPVAPPLRIDLKKDKGLTVEWSGGATSYYSIGLLRRMSPSAEQRELREEQARNPLAILPASAASSAPLTALGAELVGNYAIKITFSDGHDTGIYSWTYLRSIDTPPAPPDPAAGDS